MFEIVGGIIVLTIMVLLSGIKTVKEYDQLVVFRFGKVAGSKGPGLQMVIPLIEKAQTVDTRLITLAIPILEELTLDKASVKVSAVCLFQVVDARKAVTKIDDVSKATGELAQTTLRHVISQTDLRHLLSERGSVSGVLKSRLDRQTREWGVRIKSFEIKEVKIPREIKKALARLRRTAPGWPANTHLKTDSEHMQRVASYLR
jgi:regulator of protease activity HflC (stomatin/prohibitin superfamily)